MNYLSYFKRVLILMLCWLFCQQVYAQEIDEPAATDEPATTEEIAEAVVERPKIGLALGGGGALGFAHVGVLKVLEEYHIPVDVITGTSIGSVIGSLYALGYSAHDIEIILRDEIDFTKLLDDTLSRRYQSMIEKTYSYNSKLQLRFGENGIEPISGLSEAVEVENMLDYYLWSGGSYESFKDFPRPFACIATDLITNQPVVLTEGSLSKAVRASMAFPTIFTPVIKDGMMLSDGGLIRNLPVEDALMLGADYVIAVDLAKEVPNNAEKGSILAGLVKFLLESSTEVNVEQVALADVVLHPDLTNYEIYSFDKVQELIDVGEAAARAMLPELLPYALSVEDYPQINDFVADYVYIDEIEVSGTKVPKLVESYFNFELPNRVTREQIVHTAKLLSYNSYFKRAHYYYSGTKLVIEVEEAAPYALGVNFGYNSDFGLMPGFGVTLNLVHPWLFYLQGKMNYVNGISSKGYATIGYHQVDFVRIYTKWSFSNHFSASYRPPDSKVVPERRIFNEYNGNLGLALNFNASHYIEVGYQLGYWNSDQVHNALTEDFGTQKEGTYSLMALLYGVDTLNNKFYPQEGFYLMINGNLGGNSLKEPSYFLRVDGEVRVVLPLPAPLSLELGSEGGVALADDELPFPFYFQLGGLSSDDRRTKLPGIKIGSVYGQSMWALNAKLMATFLSRFHAMLEWHGALLSPSETLQFSGDHLYETASLNAAADFGIFRVEQGFYYDIRGRSFYNTLIISTEY